MGTLKNKMKLFALLAVAAVQARQVNVFADLDLNAVCTDDDTCKDGNAECKELVADSGEKKCVCKPGFKEDSAACVADPPAYGKECDAENPDLACTGEGQTCGTDDPPVCVCDSGYKENSGKDGCEEDKDAGPKPPALGEECNDSDLICSIENAECGATSKTCDCKSGFVEKDGACVVLTSLDDACADNSVCTGDGQVCQEGTCQCDTGLVANGGTCSKSSSMTIGLGAALLAIIL